MSRSMSRRNFLKTAAVGSAGLCFPWANTVNTHGNRGILGQTAPELSYLIG